MRPLVVAAALLSLTAPTRAALLHRSSRAGRASSISLRERLHVNPLITEPDTMEVDWAGSFSTAGSFTLPATIRYTPEGKSIWWGRTEFSASFDSLSSVVQNGDRDTHFSDRVTLTGASVVHDGKHFDLAIAPLASFLLRGDKGRRFGASAIGRYDWGKNSAGLTVTWTGATAPSDTNPAGTFDLGAGFGRHLAAKGPGSRLTAHANWLYERSTGVPRQMSLFEGVECQITSNLAIDISGQHFAVWGGTVDHQISVGLNIGTGRFHRKH
jgi:hypothetical protein